MDIQTLAQHIRLKVDLSDDEVQKLSTFFTEKSLAKKTFLSKEGQFIDTMAFVTSGCLRSYSVDENGFEHILQFAPVGWWITDMFALLKGGNSDLNVEAIIDSEVLLLNRKDQMDLFDALPKMERYFRILTENALCATRQRVMENMSLTAKERYLQFCDTYPDSLIHKVPQKHVAAYIGVTPEFLSKMRSQLYKG